MIPPPPVFLFLLYPSIASQLVATVGEEALHLVEKQTIKKYIVGVSVVLVSFMIKTELSSNFIYLQFADFSVLLHNDNVGKNLPPKASLPQPLYPPSLLSLFHLF